MTSIAIPEPFGAAPRLAAAVPDDALLAARAASGDEAAFAAIMRRHNRLLFRTARSILKNDRDCEDTLQEAYLHAWRGLRHFRADAKLSTWLVRIVINEAFSRLRRRGLPTLPADDDADSAQEGIADDADLHPAHHPERVAMRAQLRQLLEAHIDTLPDAFRSVFMLRAVEELSVDDVATLLDIPAATVRTRYFRARGLLRAHIAKDIGVTVADAFGFDGERCDRIVAGVLARIAAQAAVAAAVSIASATR